VLNLLKLVNKNGLNYHFAHELDGMYITEEREQPKCIDYHLVS